MALGQDRGYANGLRRSASLKSNQVGADTAIDFGGKTMTILTGIQASNLTLGNSSQFVFAENCKVRFPV